MMVNHIGRSAAASPDSHRSRYSNVPNARTPSEPCPRESEVLELLPLSRCPVAVRLSGCVRCPACGRCPGGCRGAQRDPGFGSLLGDGERRPGLLRPGRDLRCRRRPARLGPCGGGPGARIPQHLDRLPGRASPAGARGRGRPRDLAPVRSRLVLDPAAADRNRAGPDLQGGHHRAARRDLAGRARGRRLQSAAGHLAAHRPVRGAGPGRHRRRPHPDRGIQPDAGRDGGDHQPQRGHAGRREGGGAAGPQPPPRQGSHGAGRPRDLLRRLRQYAGRRQHHAPHHRQAPDLP